MKRIRNSPPSPAIFVAVLALVAALAGTAIAGSDVRSSAINKKKVKKIATTQINELAPGLSVANAETANTAQSADTAQTAETAASADTATVAGDVRYVTSGSNLINFVTNTDQTVQTLNLPAGVWALTAKVTPNNNDGVDRAYDCQLLVGGTQVDRGTSAAYPALSIGLGVDGTTQGKVVATFNGAARLTSAGTARLICRTTATSGNWEARTMTAIRVAKLNGS